MQQHAIDKRWFTENLFSLVGQGSLGGCQLCSMHPTSINFRLKKLSLCLVWFIEDKKYLFVVRIALNGVRVTKVTKFESGSHSDSTALKESPQKSGSHKSPVEALKGFVQTRHCGGRQQAGRGGR